MPRNALNARLPDVVNAVVEHIHATPSTRRLGDVMLPSRVKVAALLDGLQQLSFPGYFGLQGVTAQNLQYRVGELLLELTDLLYDQVRNSLRYREGKAPDESDDPTCAECDHAAAEIVSAFFNRLPAVRQLLATDVQAAFDGDPAAANPDEVIFCYPGLMAVMTQRYAHELYRLKVPLVPRMMTEQAHGQTGIDIHPGASLGERFMIDHGTGVVIGETCVIGNNVKVYQGVTLGALAPAYGQALKGHKRHPTIEDDVVIYAGATILGGDTTIGRGSVIGGNVFITRSVPEKNQVIMEPPNLKYRDRRPKGEREETIDFQI